MPNPSRRLRDDGSSHDRFAPATPRPIRRDASAPDCYIPPVDGLADFERIGEGVQAEVYLRPDGSVLKLWRSAAADESVERECNALRALADRPGIAPTLLAVVELDGRRGLLMERVDGGGLAAALRSRPWSV